MDNLTPKDDFDRIKKMIASEDSVVGIDAKETHVIIIYMLEKIQQQLDNIEKRLGDQD